jgi:hypothetical protein
MGRSAHSTFYNQIRITSYINNLHPGKNQALYRIIEDIITKAIPQWGMTLGPLRGHNYRKRIEMTEVEFDPDPDQMEEHEKPQQGEDENEDDYYERVWQWENDIRRTVQPEPGVCEPWPEFRIDLKEVYAHRGLQVIVKLANIELTPEKPEYSVSAGVEKPFPVLGSLRNPSKTMSQFPRNNLCRAIAYFPVT